MQGTQAMPNSTRAVISAGAAAEPLSQPEARRWWWFVVAFPGLTIGALILLIVTIAAIAAPLITQVAPEYQDYMKRLARPSAQAWLGGDEFGRDVFSRLMYAGRVSLTVGILSMLVTIVVGVAIGAISGFYGGWVDRILMRLTDVVLVIPTFFLLILTVATFGRSISLLVLTIGLTSWPVNARVVRGEILQLRGREYVTASRISGAHDGWIILRHLLPQLIPIIIASATIRVANNILIESGLSYLGLGVQPPTPTWGNMVNDGAEFMRQAWWLVAIPGVTIFLVVLAFNLVGEGLRDALDPRRRGGHA